jgi:two-component system nitrate/nitrite sensor histidine kinase NarX
VQAEQIIGRGECVCGWVAAGSEAYVLDDLAHDPRVTRAACKRFGFHTVVAIPLRAHGRTLGVLTLHHHAAREFSAADRALMSALGDQLGVAIDNALLYSEMEARVNELSRQVKQLAVLEERDRLAREMHDGFAQALALLNLKLQVAQRSSNGQHELKAALGEMRTVVDETYEDVRQAISDLRTPLPTEMGLVTSLSQYVQTFALRYALEAEIVVGAETPDMRVAPEIEIQVMRIVQEALANVRKHARAKHIQASLARRDGLVKIEIQDDGQGFDPADSARTTGHFGLAIMRERAASFGGRLRIVGQPGAGTTISLDVPIQPE